MDMLLAAVTAFTAARSPFGRWRQGADGLCALSVSTAQPRLCDQALAWRHAPPRPALAHLAWPRIGSARARRVKVSNGIAAKSHAEQGAGACATPLPGGLS